MEDPAKAEETREDASPLSIGLQHAVRRWQAETENAARLASRENGILTLIAAVLSIGLFKVGDFAGVQPASVSIWVKACLTASLLAMGAALVRILLVRLSSEEIDTSLGPPRRQIFASNNLRWPLNPALHPAKAPLRDTLEIAYKQTTRAANSLHVRNLRRKESIDSGQHWLLVAASLAGVALLIYMWLAAPGAPTAPAPQVEGAANPK